VSGLFIEDVYVGVSSFVAFILSIVTIWIGGQFKYQRFELPPLHFRRKIVDEKQMISPPWISLETRYIYLILLSLIVVIFMKFMQLSYLGREELAVLQSFLYVLFFVFLSLLFSMLLYFTKDQYDYQQEQKTFPKTVQTLLEDYGQLNQGLSIESNVLLGYQDLMRIGIKNIFSARLLKIKVPSRSKSDFNVIVDDKGNLLIRTLTNEELQKLEQALG
jgi:hypothetical protein